MKNELNTDHKKKNTHKANNNIEIIQQNNFEEIRVFLLWYILNLIWFACKYHFLRFGAARPYFSIVKWKWNVLQLEWIK